MQLSFRPKIRQVIPIKLALHNKILKKYNIFQNYAKVLYNLKKLSSSKFVINQIGNSSIHSSRKNSQGINGYFNINSGRIHSFTNSTTTPQNCKSFKIIINDLNSTVKCSSDTSFKYLKAALEIYKKSS
ncbi:hypothetical protein ACFL2K_05410 [Candidatus Margulisiibacteriota bacterium]